MQKGGRRVPFSRCIVTVHEIGAVKVSHGGSVWSGEYLSASVIGVNMSACLTMSCMFEHVVHVQNFMF